MALDIEYLLLLQNLRNSLSDVWTPVFAYFSDFCVTMIMLFPTFIYWCVNKRGGLFVFLSWKISVTLNAIVKLTCCVYRPWIRDARVIPAGNALNLASGYSFPSGHTMMAAPIYGSMAVLSRSKFIKALLIFIILLLAFSRNFLGVHTPQDVIVGTTLGLLAVYAAYKILKYLDAKPERENLVIALLFLFGLATLIYITYKPYLMDYKDGKLLVDPVRMQIDAWHDAGGLMAFAFCWFIEKTFIKFKATGFNAKGVIINIIGLIPVYIMIKNFLRNYTILYFGVHWGHLIDMSIMTIYIMIIWPLILKRLGYSED